MSGFGRTALAIIVVLVASTLLNTNVPSLNTDMSNFEELRFWLAVKSAISYFFAAGLGAIVARRTFVVPALALAVVGWVVTINILHQIALVAGPSSYMKIATDNWLGLILLVIAATAGAIAGRWFYKHEVENVAAAA
jgi:hypothetical protein